MRSLVPFCCISLLLLLGTGVAEAGDFALPSSRPHVVPRTRGLEVARTGSAQTISSSTFTAVLFDTLERNDLGFWEGIVNPTRLTFRMQGYYFIDCTSSFASNSTGARHSDLLLNGGTTYYGSQDSPTITTSVTNVRATTLLYVNAGDYLEFRVWQNSGGNLALSNSPGYYAHCEVARLF